MTEYKPRSYQKQAVLALLNYFRDGGAGHPLIVAPTGSGKSHVLGYFCQLAFNKWPAEKILVLTHTKEIIRQDARIIAAYTERSRIGIYSVGLHRREIKSITIGSIQSVYKKAHLFKDYRLIIVDEAHLIPPKGEGRYQTFFKEMPQARVIGVTATPFRRAHGMLTEGHIFDKIVHNIELQTLIDIGDLVPLSTKATDYALNVKGVKVLGGDFSKADLSRKLDHKHITNTIIKELVKFKELRKSWLVFAIDIAHCEHIAKQLNSVGIMAAAVHSRLDFDRKYLLDLFKASKLQAIVSVETLTTGFDAPNVDLIVMMRPTASPVLHVQMLGRGMRPNEGKDNCLVLDFAGNVSRLGPVDMVSVEKKRRGKGRGGGGFTKICPDCKEIVHTKVKECPACGHKFKFAPKLRYMADDGAILKKDAKPKIRTYENLKITYKLHKKPGKIPSFKVTYIAGLNFVSEWIAFEHKGYPRLKAERWWRKRGHKPVPNTVAEALQRQSELCKPSSITVDYFGKYPNILGVKFK